jgi:hypothetical protein
MVGRSSRSPRIYLSPNMSKFIVWKQPLGRKECPYNYRWIIDFKLFSIRLHKWVASDDLRCLHDHPSWFITIVLRGSYIDITENGEELLESGVIRFRPALHKHAVKVVDKPCWTLLLFGRPKRIWGFYVDGRFRRREKYFKRFGHHPCDEPTNSDSG